MDIGQLLEQCRQGNAKAQEWVYYTYATPMFRLCYRYCKSQPEAEDLVHKGFFKFFEHLPQFQFRNEKSLAAWIKKIMVNECLMYLRQTTNFNLTCSLNEKEHHPDVSFKAESDTHFSAEAIYSYIRELPTGYRTVFNLYELEGYSHKEIADRLQISELTSRSQLSKAKALLRQLLTNNNLHHATG